MGDKKNLPSAQSEEKPLFFRPKEWVKNLVDSNKPMEAGMKNPLVWFIALIVASILIYFKDFS